jgi:hypothetical protein
MPVTKKQKGGIIDDPKKCNNDSTPIYLEDITEDSNVLYVGSQLEDDKYNCFKPEELKLLILNANKNNEIPLNPLTREPLDSVLIQRIKDMYPDEFTAVIDLEQNEEPELVFRANIPIQTMIPILVNEFPATSEGDRRQTRNHESRIKPLKDILRESYGNDERWNRWYNNTNIPMEHKNAMINLFKLVDTFSGNVPEINKKLIVNDKMDLLNYPINSNKDYRFHYIYRDFPNIQYIVGIIITYKLDDEESNERLDELNIENKDEWSVYKLCGMAIEGDLTESRERMSDILTSMLGYDNNKKLLVIGYDFIINEPDSPFSEFVFNLLDFYKVGDTDSETGMSYDYAEIYSTYDSDDNKLYIGKYEEDEPENVGGGRKKKRSLKLKYKKKKKSKVSKRSSRKASKKRSLRRK